MSGRVRMWLAAVAVLALVLTGIAQSVFTVGPARTVLVERDGKIVAGPLRTGVHWKVPLVESLVSVPGGVMVMHGRVRAGASEQGFAAEYAVVWRVANARRFYQTTGGRGSNVASRLSTPADSALRQRMTKAGAARFLATPVASANTALSAAVRAPARKLGIEVVKTELTGVSVPATLRKRLANRMASEAASKASAAESSSRAAYAAATKRIQGRTKAILSDARREAASLQGKADARIAGIYARAGKAAPGFFRFYRALESEERALRENTRVLVVSTDSPWFRTLEAKAGKGKGR